VEFLNDARALHEDWVVCFLGCWSHCSRCQDIIVCYIHCLCVTLKSRCD